MKIDDEIIETKCGNDFLSILLRPRESRIFPDLIKVRKSGERRRLVEHYPQRYIQEQPVKFVPFRVKITPNGIEHFKENDKSITYRRGNTVWYKSHQEAEPEILAFKNLAIWNYDEFLADVDKEGISYRVFYNPVSGKFIVNKIVSFDYDGKGTPLLENPKCDEETVNEVMKLLKKRLPMIPASQRKNTQNSLKRKMDELFKPDLAKSPYKVASNERGRPKESYLRNAFYWAVTHRASEQRGKKINAENIRQTYEVFGKQATSFIAFRVAFYNLGAETWNAWREENSHKSERENKKVSYEKFVKKYLKISSRTR